MVRSLPRLLKSSDSKQEHKQHFCMNCLQGFLTEISRDKHFESSKDNKTVRIRMPKKGSLVKLHDGQYQFRLPFVMYADFEAILEPIQATSPQVLAITPTQKCHTPKELINTFSLVSA